ncbi:oxidoreductase CipA [Penicillium hispanicum]|uniref:oxidoreductase CipA n=1 Tax=Penicillium hispanicum TaxID=1080232 RepID=UPI0025424144|nr:oxidoreductase CipA [Penicillium hispanicum]KAJ5584803.1 oxidoreductase CipA [Penicillium hispanicum]
MAITKVALAGGTGNLGPAILNALVAANFEVTLLSRSSTHQLDSRVKIQVVDYNSQDSLVAALKGQDAVVNVLGVGSIPREVHLRLIDAAHAAGVQRYVPSEFGSNTAHPLTAKLPVFGDKIAVVQHLQELSQKDNAFSYTSIITGPFLDWGLEKKFIANVAGPSSPVFDGGDTPFSTTTLGAIGRAVAGVLRHPDETKNRYVHVSEAEVTQNQLLQWSGKGDQIQREPVATADLEKQAYEVVKQSPPDFGTFAVNLIKRAVFAKDYGGAFTNTDIELLGIPKLSEAQIIELVKQNA